MRSQERHHDAGAYALGVLDEVDAFRFEDHLMECPQCAAQISEFGPATRQLMLYRQATPRVVHPFAGAGPRLLDRLLGEVAARHRARRRRVLYAVAASVVVALAGPALMMLSASGGDREAVQVTATDERSGVWAQVTVEDEAWGSNVQLQVKDGAGPRNCRLIVVGRDGSERTVTNWMVPHHDARPTSVQGGTDLHVDDILRYEIRSAEGEQLVTLKAP